MQQDNNRKRTWGINRNVLFLGISSLLTDISSEMIFTLIPLFLANILGATTTVIGFVGGFSESIDAIFRIFSGWFSDRIKNRKLLTVAGYSFSTLVKPLMFIATVWPIVLGIRFGDRVGKGLRSSDTGKLQLRLRQREKPPPLLLPDRPGKSRAPGCRAPRCRAPGFGIPGLQGKATCLPRQRKTPDTSRRR